VAPPPIVAAPVVAPPPVMGPAPLPMTAAASTAPIVEPPAPASDPPQASPDPNAAAARDDEHPLATTNSPWTAEKKVDAEALPSAVVRPSVPVVRESKPPAPAPAVAEAPRSRSGMTVLLALAALGLIGALAYFFIIERRPSANDPAKVNVGTEQRDYDMGQGPQNAPSASETADAPPPPPPPPPPPKIVPKPTIRPPAPPPDIYEP
jgi:hypothetical protein